VYLSHYTFSSANVPYVYTNEGLDIPFKLRVKIMGVPGYGNGFHAAQAWNNNYYSLESLPPPGTYTVALYWLKYASDWTTLLEVGPQTTTTITVQSPPAVNGVAWGAINLPTDGSGIGLPGQSITATASVTNNGSTTWNSNYYLELKDSNGTPLSYPSINGVSPGNSTTATFGLTLPATAGVYTYAFTALQNNVQYFGGTQSRTITVNRNPVTSSFTASASAISAGQSVTLSSIVTDPDSNLTSQAIDYLAPGSGTWTSGTVGAGTRWDGAVTGANTLTKAMLLSTDGTWQFRVRGGDALGGTSAFLYQNVTVTTTTPVITTQPTSQSAFVGGAVTFSVGAGGAAPLNYQWRKNGANVGTNSASLTISAATAADAASYTVTVSNAFGSVTSNPVTLTVSAIEPIRLAVKYWQANDFPGITIDDYEDVEVSGTRTIDEYDEWGNWTGSYEEEYTEIQSQWVGSTTYANGRFGSRWDTTAGTFDIATAASGYSAATANRGFFVGTYAPGDYITFHAFASAPSANCSSFTWTLFAPSNGPIVASSFGASSPHSFYAYHGTGYYRVEVSYQNATSGTPLNATVSYYIPVGVSLPPTITTQPGPTNQTVASGATVTYSVVASLATTYQWRKDGVSISGATASTLTLTNVQPSNSGSYTVVVSNTGGSQTSAAANLTVSVTAPAISSQPVSQTTNVSQPVSFAVAATGTAPLAYQWLKNGVALAGATNANLTLANPQTMDAANAPGYTVMVSNLAGTVTSSAATLTVNLVAPSITTQPISQSTFTGGTVTFSVVVGGTAPFSYQWRKNGVNVGPNSSSYTISSALTSDAGAYSVVVSNGAGAVTSNSANLTVTVVEPIRLAVKYWRANDYPNRTWYTYEEVWVGDWRTVDDYDENGDWSGSHDEWIDWEWQWVYHYAPTGEFAPRWDTTAGDFDLASTASGYSAANANRGYFKNAYNPGDLITFHPSATAPSANCSNYTWALFSPSGSPIAGYWFSGSTAWSFYANYGVGNYRVDVSYQSATSGTPLNATVSYYIPVGVAPPAVPAITSPLAASGTVGTAFAYTITATNSPNSYVATGLPAGLSLNTSNGAITGTPTAAGNYSVSLTASNSGGTSQVASVLLSVGSALVAPAPVALPAEQITDSRFLASWLPVSGATGYRLDVSTNAGFSNLVLSNYAPVYIFNGVSSIATSHTVSGLSAKTDYWYRVRVVTAAGTSENSASISVRTAAPVAGAASVWFDKPVDVRVNGVWTKVYDGVADEIIPAGGLHGLNYYVLDWRSTATTITFNENDYDVNDWWYPRTAYFDVNDDGSADFSRPAFTPFWQSGFTFTYPGEIYRKRPAGCLGVRT
jgi:hypothetical protein